MWGAKNQGKVLYMKCLRTGLFCSDFFSFFFFFSERSQNNIAVILGAAVGGAAMLLIVVVVLLLRRRLVIMFPCLSVCLSVPFTSLTAPPSSGLLSHYFAFSLWGLRMAFTFTLSSPLSFCPPLANLLSLFFWIHVQTLTGEEFALNAPCHFSMAIFQ